MEAIEATEATEAKVDEAVATTAPAPPSRGWKFYAVFASLALSSLLAGLEATIASPALPFITEELNTGENYIWILNGYLLTSTAFLPIFGQISQVFGRRWPQMIAVAIFLLGSGICGGATSSGMIIAGRLVQGTGGAGITALTEITVSDLVAVRERGQYIGMLYAAFGLGTALGPVIGGAITQNTTWRWVYYLNLPIGGFALAVQFLFLQVEFVRKIPIREKMGKIDWAGNFLIIASVVSILIALTWADTLYSWGDFHILVPLVLGFAGIAAFHALEASPWVVEPTIPPFVFNHRTSTIGLIVTFITSMTLEWQIFFLPVYFESGQGASVERAGVLLLACILVGVVMSIVAGALIAITGRYKPIHIFGLAVSTLAAGLFINFDSDSSLAKVVLYQFVTGIGCGFLLSSFLPGIQNCHPQTTVAAVTATWVFYRQFGATWGATIPAAIFNSQMTTRLSSIGNAAIQELLGGGNAYSHVSAAAIAAIQPPELQDQVIDAYMGALRVVWEVLLAFNVLALIMVLFEKELPLRDTLESEVQLRENNNRRQQSDGEEKNASGDAEP